MTAHTHTLTAPVHPCVAPYSSPCIIIGGTVSQLLKLARNYLSGYPSTTPQLLVLDEASMVPFTHMLALACTLLDSSSGCMVLGGDHRQLAPICKHEFEREQRPLLLRFPAYQSAYHWVWALGKAGTVVRMGGVVASGCSGCGDACLHGDGGGRHCTPLLLLPRVLRVQPLVMFSRAKAPSTFTHRTALPPPPVQARPMCASLSSPPLSGCLPSCAASSAACMSKMASNSHGQAALRAALRGVALQQRPKPVQLLAAPRNVAALAAVCKQP